MTTARFLRFSALVIAPLFALPAYAAGEARNVIFFLGDGMGPTVVTAARIYKYGEAGLLTMNTLPRTARIKTYSLDAQTTDSAPSMAAYMTGVKTRNEVLSMDGTTTAYVPGTNTQYSQAATVTGASSVSGAQNNCPVSGNGSASKTLLEYAVAAGKATGVVTTARLTHATPAVNYAHVCNRNLEYEIARQAVPGGAGYNPALGSGVDVLLGGTSYFWRPYPYQTPADVLTSTVNKGRLDGRNLITEMQTAGYTFVSDRAGLLAAATGATSRVFGLFDQADQFQNQGHMNYELDRNATTEPSLSEMTSKAIDVLAAKNKGYFLMVEGGRIDHALHGTNAARALADTIAFDDAIKTALAKVDLTNTLIVVTADHDHTMAFNGYSSKGNNILGKADNWQTPGVADITTPSDHLPYTTLVFGNGSGTAATAIQHTFNPFNQIIATSGKGAPRAVSGARIDLTAIDTTVNDYIQDYGVQTGTGLPGGETHGGGDVMLFATGAGSALFKGTLNNTAVFGLVKSAFGF